MTPKNTAAIDALKSALPPASWTEDPAKIEPHLSEWRDRYFGNTPIMLMPANTQETAVAVKICKDYGLKITPQGGNTGLVGGQVPKGEILLSTRRLTNVREVSPLNDCLIAEAGVTLKTIQDKAKEAGRYFPLSLASEGSCTIGGNLSTNAGGMHVIKYGTARNLCFGVEAVLPSGEIFHGLNALYKNNTGYDTSGLLIGSEGTLGIITAASLKLSPIPNHIQRAFVAVSSADNLLRLLELCEKGGHLALFEIMSQAGLDMVTRHIPNMKNPIFETSPWYALLDWEAESELEGQVLAERYLASGLAQHLITDAVIASSLKQADNLLALRENMSEAQKHEGASIKMDISLPISALPEFIQRAETTVQKIVPGCRPVPFGHLGDGNLHYNISQPENMSADAFLTQWEVLSEAVFDLVGAMDGSFSAEHGIGIMKKHQLLKRADPAKLSVMRGVKRALDPDNMMNPRVMI